MKKLLLLSTLLLPACSNNSTQPQSQTALAPRKQIIGAWYCNDFFTFLQFPADTLSDTCTVRYKNISGEQSDLFAVSGDSVTVYINSPYKGAPLTLHIGDSLIGHYYDGNHYTFTR